MRMLYGISSYKVNKPDKPKGIKPVKSTVDVVVAVAPGVAGVVEDVDEDADVVEAVDVDKTLMEPTSTSIQAYYNLVLYKKKNILYLQLMNLLLWMMLPISLLWI